MTTSTDEDNTSEDDAQCDHITSVIFHGILHGMISRRSSLSTMLEEVVVGGLSNVVVEEESGGIDDDDDDNG